MSRYVFDTNILLISLPHASRYRKIFEHIIDGKFELVITNDILEEYCEVISQKTNHIVANNIAELLITLPNVLKVDVFFKWHLI